MRTPRLAALLAVIHALACAKGAVANGPGSPPPDAGAPGDAGSSLVVVAEDPRAEALWRAAADGDADDQERLAAYVGSDVLAEASIVPARRATALRALAFSDDFVPLPFLARVATSAPEGEAATALESAAMIAARPRRATDAEDALELHEGTVTLLALAKDTTRPAKVRALTIRALRLLAARGALLASEIPTDLDAR